MPVGVFIADDHGIIRSGLKTLIESQQDMVVIGEADNGVDAVTRVIELRPDVVIMDISMPRLNGTEATKQISDALPEIKVVILSMHHTDEHVFRAMKAGARGYILKESAGPEVVNAVRAVMAGDYFFGNGVQEPPADHHRRGWQRSKSPIESLSSREREVLQLVAEGRTSIEIANMLSISQKSVETYRSRLMQKLGIENVAALVKFAVAHGLTPSS
ncbi:MAG: response regulator transcription factor [Nitrospirae bacterium]|nr:response regulator transcription factor [Nitrospirota bacterium]